MLVDLESECMLTSLIVMFYTNNKPTNFVIKSVKYVSILLNSRTYPMKYSKVCLTCSFQKRTKTPTTSEVQQNNETAEARKPNLTESDEGSVQEENMKPGSSKRTRAQTKGKEGEVQKTTTTNENTMESEVFEKVFLLLFVSIFL